MKIHRLFLYIWQIELLLLPILALLDFGFSVAVDSNFFPRFSYITIFLIACYYHFSTRRGLVSHPLVAIFFLILVIGVAKGFFENQLNSIFLSHIFYVIMPIIMCSYGWHFLGDYVVSDSLQRQLDKTLKSSFYIGLIVVALFQILYFNGFANYNAIGIWNFLYSAPYLLQQPNGQLFFIISFLFTFLAGKKGVFIAFCIYWVILFYVLNITTIIRFILIILFVGSILFLQQQDIFIYDYGRIGEAVSALIAGDFDAASSMRWAEAASAFEYLNARVDHWVLGAGFGSSYQPYPKLEGYEDFYRHYTHFGVVSYIWIGGFIAPILIYSVLLITAVKLTWRLKSHNLDQRLHFFVYWIWAIILISMFGAVLMNNSFLWFIVGCCLRLKKL